MPIGISQSSFPSMYKQDGTHANPYGMDPGCSNQCKIVTYDDLHYRIFTDDDLLSGVVRINEAGSLSYVHYLN